MDELDVSSMEVGGKALHIVSWNVAGWPKTVACINRFHGSVDNFMRLHSVDILCLQEVKTTVKKLTADPAAHCATLKG